MYDFVNELGYLALATRLKRISDAMVHSGREMYKQLGYDIEPNWYLIFKLLNKYETLSITEIANKLHFAHPSVITLISKMEKSQYVTSFADREDARKKNYRLTEKAINVLPELERIWDAGTVGVAKLFKEGTQFLEEVERLEIQLSQENFKDRTLKELNHE